MPTFTPAKAALALGLTFLPSSYSLQDEPLPPEPDRTSELSNTNRDRDLTDLAQTFANWNKLDDQGEFVVSEKVVTYAEERIRASLELPNGWNVRLKQPVKEPGLFDDVIINFDESFDWIDPAGAHYLIVESEIVHSSGLEIEVRTTLDGRRVEFQHMEFAEHVDRRNGSADYYHFSEEEYLSVYPRELITPVLDAVLAEVKQIEEFGMKVDWVQLHTGENACAPRTIQLRVGLKDLRNPGALYSDVRGSVIIEESTPGFIPLLQLNPKPEDKSLWQKIMEIDHARSVITSRGGWQVRAEYYHQDLALEVFRTPILEGAERDLLLWYTDTSEALDSTSGLMLPVSAHKFDFGPFQLSEINTQKILDGIAAVYDPEKQYLFSVTASKVADEIQVVTIAREGLSAKSEFWNPNGLSLNGIATCKVSVLSSNDDHTLSVVTRIAELAGSSERIEDVPYTVWRVLGDGHSDLIFNIPPPQLCSYSPQYPFQVNQADRQLDYIGGIALSRMCRRRDW